MNYKKGFTLIELLVVVAIIGVLASVVLSSLNDARARARDAKRLADIRIIQTALELYNLDNGEYPSSSGISGGTTNAPNSSWANSAYESWENLETILGTTLPRDPLNQEGFSSTNPNGPYNYSYFSSVPGCPGLNDYFISVKLESYDNLTLEQRRGVNRCDTGVKYYYGSAITAGASAAE